MPIPTLTPPTDNFYKFLAISGLVVTIFCVVYPTSFLTANNSIITTLSTDLRKLEVDYEYLERSTAVQASQTQTAVDDIRNQPQVQQKFQEIEHRIIQVDELIDQETRKLKNLDTIRQVLYIFSLISSFVTGASFYLWYSRVQKHQDKLLEMDVASKLKIERTEPKTAKSENELSQSSIKAPEIVNKSPTTSPTHKG
jgi:hypothetical protein